MHLDELQQAIRYAISQLSALNGQTDFERICLHFSRARIHKNILPATGSVQAGGDQGRDFETFHSYLADSPIGASSFVGAFSKKPVAFACSLEKNPTKKNGKIYSDVKTIMSSGFEVERIYFFSGEDIAVGKRHKIQEELKNEFSVEVEIIDAQALSQHLADQDLFWIAIQYLKIPSEYYPKQNSENWYSKLYKEYQERSQAPTTIQEFSDIKAAVRYIYKKIEFRNDLIFWVGKLNLIINDSSFPEYLRRKAIYEKFVVCLMGLDNVEGLESNVEQYYLNFEKYVAPADIEDAQVLLSFLWNSMHLGRHQMTKEYLIGISNRLEIILKERIKKVDNVDTKCALLEIYANFLFHDQRNKQNYALNMSRYCNTLKKIIPLLRRTHFFPISHFADRLNKIIDILLETPVNPKDIEILAVQVDDILASKSGAEIVAEKLRVRAKTYLDKKLDFKAIATLHDLKIKWYNKDTLKGSILSCLLLADAYRNLHQFFAAKYYAWVGSYLAINSNEVEYSPLFVRGMSIAADCDYASGSWYSYFDLTDLLLASHVKMTKDFNVFDHDDTYKILYYPSIILESSSVFLPTSHSHFKSVIAKWGFIKDEIAEINEKIKVDFNTNDQESFRNDIQKQIFGIPFNDAGKTRRVSFNSWGCDWNFQFENNYLTNAIAEEFIATFQIILTDLTETELYVVKTKINIEIKLKEKGEAEFKRLPSNTESIWLIELPAYSGSSIAELNKHQFNYLVIAQAIICEISILPLAEYKKIIGKKLKDENLIGKASFGRPYENLYHNFMFKENFERSNRGDQPMFEVSDEYVPIINQKFPWRNVIAPKYNRSKSLQAISNRVEALKKVLSISLAPLNQDRQFKEIIAELKREGWLDWQLLHVVGTIVVNFKGQFTGKVESQEIMKKKFQDFFFRDEKEWFKPIPPGLLTYDRIKKDLNSLFVATMLPSFDLDFHSETPNGNAIVELLKERFNFFEDGKEIAIF
ncbi:MAG: hypothetical protein QM737_09990 [Ferruginibacter sp.]